MLRGITTAVAVAYFTAVKSGPASKTSYSLAFLIFFCLGDGILAPKVLMSTQILVTLDNSLSLVPSMIYNFFSQLPGCAIARNGVEGTFQPPG